MCETYYEYVLRKMRGLFTKLNTLVIRHNFRELQSWLDPRVQVTNPQYVSIGAGVSIRPHVWIYAITDDTNKKGAFAPAIKIGDGCSIGRFCHITAANRIVLKEKVFLTEGVLITDTIHGYERIDIPIIDQPIVPRGPVIIGRGTWVGNGARIIGQVHIGRNCIISANAVVVNHDLPDYCVVAGVPARIVKYFDMEKKEWVMARDHQSSAWEVPR